MQKPIKEVYTDIALEVAEGLGEGEEGVELHSEDHPDAELKVSSVRITNEKGGERIGKPVGTYVTLESPRLRDNDAFAHEIIISQLADELIKMAELKQGSSVLIVGLGNWNVTPDALGPRVVSKVLVTRHLVETTAVDTHIDYAVRSVCAISPGVMGITGIETGEIILGIVERVQPDLVVAVDALAARSIQRINTTIQLANTGINPGAGLGNKRMGLNKETLGVPVMAVGVPTVVDAATLINDTLDEILEDMAKHSDDNINFYKNLQELQSHDKYGLIKETLRPYSGNMFVTPKEVDAVVDRLSRIISNGINIALHPGITSEDINRYF